MLEVRKTVGKLLGQSPHRGELERHHVGRQNSLTALSYLDLDARVYLRFAVVDAHKGRAGQVVQDVALDVHGPSLAERAAVGAEVVQQPGPGE